MFNPVERLRRFVGRSQTTTEDRQTELEKVQRRAQAKAVRQEHKRDVNPPDRTSGITPGGGSF